MAGEEIPMMFYADWYNDDVRKHLTRKQKEAILKRISDISLQKDITSARGSEFSKGDFPELAPYMHTEKLSGLQLYAVMTELFHELHPKQAQMIGKPYPDLRIKKKLRKVIR